MCQLIIVMRLALMRVLETSLILAPSLLWAKNNEGSSREFNFQDTRAIYHIVGDSGIIYVRPNGYPEEYDENQGFIVIYDALFGYLIELDQLENDMFFMPSDSPSMDELMFITVDSKKSYFLKDGWVGDGERWVAMYDGDYNKIKNMIDGRKDLPGSRTDSVGLNNFTNTIVREAQNEKEVQYIENKIETSQVSNRTQDAELNRIQSVGKDAAYQEEGIVEIVPIQDKQMESIPKNSVAETRPSKNQEENPAEFVRSNHSASPPDGSVVNNGWWVLVAVFLLFLAVAVCLSRLVRPPKK